VGAGGGYREVLAEGPVRRLLAASLTGRLAFAMLPLAFVLFAAANAGTAAAGVLVAAFSATSVLAPARGRIVDRRGPPALIAFAFACSGALAALAAAGSADAPAAVLVVVGGLAGLAVPPLGPFTRAAWGRALGGDRLQRIFALDSAGEEAALIVAPLAVAGIVAVASPEAALLVAAAGLLAGTGAAGRSVLAQDPGAAAPSVTAAARRLPPALWLTIASLLGPGAALGAIDLAVPALARSAGAPARAGLLLAALAAGTATASLLAGRRRWAWPATRRLPALQLTVAGALAGAAAVAGRPAALAVVLVAVGMALGAQFVTVYPLVDELAPAGAATRSFAWLVTANNAGIGIGAALAGQLDGGAAGLWLAAGCALAGLPVTLAIGLVRSRADIARRSLGSQP
jgi:hypothetical protein